MTQVARAVALAALVSTTLTTIAFAGGFQRGTADTDILFEKGGFSTRNGVTYVSPRRGYDEINGQSGNFGDYTENYLVPSLSVYFGTEAFGCAGHYTESFGAEVDYSGLPGGALPRQNSATQSTSNVDRLDFSSGVTSRTRSVEFDSDEFGATCRLSYKSEQGRFSLLGGVFFEDFDFGGSTAGQRSLNGLLPAALAGGLNASGTSVILPTEISVDSKGGFQTGYRLGLAYEKPEIALRVQGIYRSEVQHDAVRGDGTFDPGTAFVQLADGTTVSVPTFFSNPLLPLSPTDRARIIGTLTALGSAPTSEVASALNTATSPQSFTINAQTGIAEGTLLLASFRWTDWSTNNAVVSTINGALAGTAFTSSSYIPFQWRDGYTANIGVGRAFNEMISGALSIGYDRGVSTGADITYTDFYSLSGGFSFKPDKTAEFRLGGLIGFLESGEQSIDKGSYYDAKVGDDLVLGLNGSFKLTF